MRLALDTAGINTDHLARATDIRGQLGMGCFQSGFTLLMPLLETKNPIGCPPAACAAEMVRKKLQLSLVYLR